MSMLQRLVLAFAIVIVIGTGQGLLMLHNLDSLGEKTTFVATKPIASVDRARGAWSAYRDSQLFLANALELTSIRDAGSLTAEFTARTGRLHDHLDQLAKATSSTAATERLTDVRANVSLWEEKARVLLDVLPAASVPSPYVLTRIEVRIRNGLDQMVALALSDAARVSADAKSSIADSTGMSIALIVASVIAGLGLALFSSLAITRPLARLDCTMRKLAAGDLTVEVTEKGRRDEIGRMAAALEVFRQNTVEMRRLDAANAVADRQMREQGVQLHTAINNMRQGLLMFDADNKVIVSNRQYAEMYGLAPDAIEPGTAAQRLLQLRADAGTFDGDPDHFIADLLLNATQTGRAIKLPDGRTISLAIEHMEGGGWVATHEDITERQVAEAKIEHMAHHDGLTGLYNRIEFRKRVEDAVPRARRGVPFAIHCIDLDRFKAVNDTFGHSIGDLLLQEVSRRLASALRETDSLARLGGDEFVVLQEGIGHEDDIAALARRIIERVSQPYDLKENQAVIGVSIGIATAPKDGIGFERLMRNADMALYRAKNGGRGTFCFFETAMDEDQRARRRMEADLREAIERNELEVYYQPLVDVETKSIVCCEALLRWNHPQRGFISPVEFIPLAEETGLIESIGEWALRQACEEASAWPAHIRVAVNLSAVQFRSRNLYAKVMSALEDSGLAPNRLELEITESVLLLDDDFTTAVLYDLRDTGIRISMDDFGTGYSSLGYLRAFPFDKIKIDRSFVNELSIDADCSTIVRAVANIGQGLGIATIAEGVETLAQFEQVRAQGCTHVQGFLFGAPCPSAAIRELISQEQKGSEAA